MDDVASWLLLIHLVADCDNQPRVHGESADRMDANNLGFHEIVDEEVDIVTRRDCRLDGRPRRHCYSTDSRDKILDRHDLSKVDALNHSIAFVVDEDFDGFDHVLLDVITFKGKIDQEQLEVVRGFHEPRSDNSVRLVHRSEDCLGSLVDAYLIIVTELAHDELVHKLPDLSLNLVSAGKEATNHRLYFDD